MSSRKEKRAECRRIFLESGGKARFTDIAAAVGASRKSIGNWCREEGWKEQLAEVAEVAKEKAITVASDSLEAAFTRDIAQLDAIASKIDSMLKKDLSVNEIAGLARAKAECVRTHRLVRGESTLNAAVAVKSSKYGGRQPTPIHPKDDPYHKALMLIGKGGTDGIGSKIQRHFQDELWARQEIMRLANEYWARQETE